MKRLVVAGMVLAMALGVAGIPADGEAIHSRQALSQVIRELNVDGVSLGKTLEYLRDVSASNMVVNWKVLEGVGVAKETPITMQVRDLTLRKMLQLVLDQASPNAQLVYSIDANVIQITTQEDADRQMITKVYIVDDLVMVPQNRQPPTLSLGVSTVSAGGGGGGSSGGGYGGGGGGGGSGSGGGGSGGLFGSSNTANTSAQNQTTAQQRGDDLAELIRQVVRPTIWHENGGPASIRYFAGKLIVTAPVSVHEAIGGPVGSSSTRYGT